MRAIISATNGLHILLSALGWVAFGRSDADLCGGLALPDSSPAYLRSGYLGLSRPGAFRGLTARGSSRCMDRVAISGLCGPLPPAGLRSRPSLSFSKSSAWSPVCFPSRLAVMDQAVLFGTLGSRGFAGVCFRLPRPLSLESPDHPFRGSDSAWSRSLNIIVFAQLYCVLQYVHAAGAEARPRRHALGCGGHCPCLCGV